MNKPKKEYPRAIVRRINGELVMVDPDGVALIQAVEKHNCRYTLEANADRIVHFTQRAAVLGKTPAEVVIVVLNVDDPRGGLVAETLMPGHDWQSFRARGEVPFARGLAGRDFIQGAIDLFDKAAGDKLRGIAGMAVVVIDHGVAEVFESGAPSKIP